MISGQSIVLLPKNPNRPWLDGSGIRVRNSLLPWAGRPPAAFKSMRGALIGRISRCQALGMSDFLSSFRVLEELREMHLL
eukprot:13786517-Heterocapsa_arctica.AAC.1